MKILIVDDEKHIRESLKKYLSLDDIDSVTAETGEAAKDLLEKEAFDAAILDLRLPGISGQDLLQWMIEQGFQIPVIMISAHGQIEDAVNALKAGARDYIVKPFDPAELIIKLRSIVQTQRLENKVQTEERTKPDSFLIGETPVMQELKKRIGKIAESDVTVLITGESGSGKEMVAREIHRLSPNCDEPFAAVNIGGIHEGLMESELFGHEKGSFTGAQNRKLGLFEVAGRGTIFLDEIGETPLPLQVKLLRVLQERKIRRLGSNVDIPVNARIISATNRDLEKQIAEGKFREDLYYRLNVFRLHCPPLCERLNDIPLLSEHVVGKLCRRMGRSLVHLSGNALLRLQSYNFPGNIRELENILERALIYGDRNMNIIEENAIEIRNIQPKEPVKPSSASETVITIDELEKKAIFEALERCNNNHSQVARELGITRKTLLNKLKAYLK
ncbi:MAG: sigma-54 dependent transcriptional regulator [Spirochaetaceae bacterium]|jgi:two-component system response regulator AtoC|nr:sigma-54 dependent transcriptional regulator [Spirochaetaceae bacterium]